MMKSLALLILPLSTLICILVLSSCAEDSVSVGFTLELDSDARTYVNTQTTAGTPIGVRILFSFSDRLDSSGNVLVGLRPTGQAVVPLEDAGVPEWETSNGQGFDYLNETVTLTNLPLGFSDPQIIVELLKKGTGTTWYPFAYHCFNGLVGQRLTKTTLKSVNGSTLIMSLGRSCGSCGTAQSFTSANVDTNLESACPR